MTKKSGIIIALAMLLAGCSTGTDRTKNTVNNMKAPNDAWVSLFNGKTTSGWHTYGKTSAGEAWKVADGNLYLDTTQKEGWQIKGGGDLVSDEEYENFNLRLEWKIAPGGNSGILFYVQDNPAKYEYVWHTGPEMQVLDNAAHPDAKIPRHRAGDLYDLIACSQETVKPAGEWNQVEISSADGNLDLYLNGTKVVSTILWDDTWKKMVAGSKFKEWPDFGTFKKGHISLQDHGNTVFYRNIKIKRL